VNLLGVVFTNPAVWVGGFIAAAPLLIHLLTKQTPRTLVFPSVRFLKSAQASLTSVFKVRHLILLAVRTLFILMLLAAFLKPSYRAGSIAANEEKTGARAAVIVVDASASMGYAGPGGSPMLRAKEAATQVIDKLGAGDAANMVIARAVPHATFDEPTANRFHLKRDLQELEPTLERADPDAAIAEAVRQLRGADANLRKEIYLISDFQRANWAGANFGAIPPEIKTIFLSAAESRTENAAVVELAAHPPSPAVLEEVEITCKVANYSTEQRTVALDLTFEGETNFNRELTIDAGMTETASFRLKIKNPGNYEGVAKIREDFLAADDKRYFTLNVAERVHVLILTDESEYDSRSSHRFLLRAIQPFEDAAAGTIDCAIARPDRLDKFELGRAQLVLIAGAQQFSAKTNEMLAQYVRDGGGIIYFLSSAADRANLKALEEVTKSDFQSPFALGAEAERQGEEGYAVLADANFDDALLRDFRDAGDLAQIQFYRALKTERNEKAGQVLLRYDDGNIAMARQSLGAGAVLLCNFSTAPARSDLAKRPLFIPLIHKMIAEMRPKGSGPREFTVGSSCSTTVRLESEDSGLEFLNPADEKIDASIEVSALEAMVICPRAEAVGFYRVMEADRRAGSIAVNLDSRESNLDALTVEQIEEISKPVKESFYAAAGARSGDLDRLLEGKPLWHYFMLIALLLLAAELGLSLVWKA
jgi:hypothetical protein